MPGKEALELLAKHLNCKVNLTVGKSFSGSLYQVSHGVYGSCALKSLGGTIVENQRILQRLNSETDRSKKIKYSKFARIYEIDFTPCPYVLREWIEGESLQDRFEQGAFTALDAAELVIDIAWGLQAAYNFGIRHKNLKPSNILLREDRSTVVVDALLPPSSPHYLSPEHCAGKGSDIRSDIYALGTIFYHALAGHPPFNGTANKIMRQHMKAKAPAIPSLPSCITRVLGKTLAKNPDKRYQTPLGLIDDLRQACRDLQVDVSSLDILPFDDLPLDDPSFEVDSSRLNKTVMRDRKSMEERDWDTTTITHEVTREITVDIVSEMESLDEKTTSLAEALEDSEKAEAQLENQDKLDISFFKKELEELEIVEIKDFIPIEPNYEDLPKDFPDYLRQALILATGVKTLKRQKETLSSFIIICPCDLKERVIEYLQTVMCRECWVVKELDGDNVELVIDLELAKTLRYFNYFDNCIQNALSKLPQLSTINKSVITRMEALDEDSADSSDIERATVSAGLSSIFSLFDTLPDEEDGSSEEVVNLEAGTIPEADAEEVPIELPEEETPKEEFLDIVVNFKNPYHTRAWFKLVKECNWVTGKHFQPKKQKKQELKRMCFTINLLELQDYNRKQMGMSSIKEFFQGDYEIARLDQGGMAAVLKLVTKNESNIILLRPENHWARQEFAPYLCVRKGAGGKEFVYAEVPRGTEFCVKVAFKGREEELIYEARLLFSLAQHPEIVKHVIGIVQQGSFLASAESEGESEELGYYLMLEYASLGNLEQFSREFPQNRLPIATAFLVLYDMVKTLRFLKQKGIIHRDIKPHNILLDNKGMVKLSDFGLAITISEAGSKLNEERRRLLRLVDKEFLQITSEKEQAEARVKKFRDKIERMGEVDQEKFEKISRDILDLYEQIQKLVKDEKCRAEDLKTRYRPMSADEIAIKGEFAGSLYYAAPEQFSPSKPLSCACDVYQLGAVAYKMLAGKPPVKGKNISQVMGEIVLGHKPKVADLFPPSPLLTAVSDLIYQMMENDPEHRITIEQVYDKMLELAPVYRDEIEIEPEYERPTSQSTQELGKWNQKVKHAKKHHQQILPQLQALINTAEQKGQVWKMQPKQILKAVYVSTPSNPKENIRFCCPNCGKKLLLPPNIVGKKIRCPNCQQRLIAKSVDS